MSLSGALNSAVSALMAQSTAIATVSDKGVVTGVGKGTTTITAECGGVKADCTVYITAK